MSDVIELRRGAKGAERSSIGMVVFLVSWGVTFLALFLAYALIRVRQPHWPPPGAPSLGRATPVANTFVAVGSSVVFDRALAAVRAGRLTRFRWLTVAGAALAVTFLVLQLNLWNALSEGGFNVGDSVYAGMFYMLTWFHA